MGDLRRNAGPFILQYEGSVLHEWGIVPTRDEDGRILACLFTSEKELIKSVVAENRSFFKRALEVFAGKRQLEEKGIRVRDDLTLEYTQG